jgi:glycosyltransferase involved in cell wall biosynthesis
MSRIGILFTIPNFITAGSGGAMLNIVRRLDRREFAPAVCVLKKGGALDAVVEDMGIPFLEAPMLVALRPLWNLRRRVRQAAAVFRPHGFQLWHSFHHADDYTEPLVARAAGARAWVFTKKNMSWNRRSWLARSVLASRIAAQNTDMLRMFFKGPLLRRKVTLIPPGVDTERYAPAVSHRSDLRVRLGISEVALLVGCVANLLPIKGQRTLIQAIQSLPGAHIVLAGPRLDENYACGLERLAEELDVAGRVHIIGAVSDVPALLSELDIFVSPSLLPGEGCPVALLEAMSSGRACVTSNVPGCREPVVNGRSGLLVPPEDPDALADALIALTSPSVRISFGEEARRRVLERFTIEQEARAYEQLYLDLARKRRL